MAYDIMSKVNQVQIITLLTHAYRNDGTNWALRLIYAQRNDDTKNDNSCNIYDFVNWFGWGSFVKLCKKIPRYYSTVSMAHMPKAMMRPIKPYSCLRLKTPILKIHRLFQTKYDLTHKK